MTTHTLAVSTPAARVLRALFELARLDYPASLAVLATCLGSSPTEVGRSLLTLERLGLAHAELARLTMRGLAVATRMPGLGISVLLAGEPGRFDVPSEVCSRAHPRASTSKGRVASFASVCGLARALTPEPRVRRRVVAARAACN
jgi:hypothetical protein